MPFVVVGENELGARGAANYRGTGRMRPPHGDDLPEDAEYNRMFFWYCEEGGESGVVSDFSRAQRLTDLLHSELGRSEFELIEVTRVGEKPCVGGKLLGHDLSCAWSSSLLSWGLFMREVGASDLPSAIVDLVELVESHFAPLLNHHGLFTDEESARFCLRSMMALPSLSPGLWENDEASDFEVVAIFKVSD